MQQRKTQGSCNENGMRTRDWIEVGASLISGAGIGAALMYLFDPQAGDKRREALSAQAERVAGSTGEALGGAWEHVSDGARYAGRHAARYGAAAASAAGDYLSSASDAAGDAGRSYWKSARKGLRGASDSAGGWLSDAGDSARGLLRRGLPEQEHHSPLELTAGAVGALALGAGLMFLLDPAQGRRRRALMRDKAYSAARQSANYAESTGRHLANKATGWAAEAQKMAGQAKDKVMSAVGQSQGATAGTTSTENQLGASCPPAL